MLTFVAQINKDNLTMSFLLKEYPSIQHKRFSALSLFLTNQVGLHLHAQGGGEDHWQQYLAPVNCWSSPLLESTLQSAPLIRKYRSTPFITGKMLSPELKAAKRLSNTGGGGEEISFARVVFLKSIQFPSFLCTFFLCLCRCSCCGVLSESVNNLDTKFAPNLGRFLLAQIEQKSLPSFSHLQKVHCALLMCYC